ncbi:MAG: UvrD-helicase domain-containing protein, partial [Succinivibrio sp.]
KDVFYDANYRLKDSCEVLKNLRHLTGLGTNKDGKIQLAARIRSAEGLEHKDEFEEATANLCELYKLVKEEAFTVETIEKELKILVSILIIRRTDEICKRDNVISNNEVLRQLAQSLRDKKRGDALASVLRKHYPVALIDEFQDTDPVQFAVFEKMYMNEDARNDSCVCYLIGDPKQSIYAFRGSDINSYNKAKELVKNLSPGKETVYTLDINYRAATNVINGVNSVFLNGPGYMCNPFGSSIPFESVSPPKKEGFKDKFNFIFNEELNEDDEADKHPVSNYVTTVFPDNNTKKKKSSENEKNNSVLASDYKKTVAMAVTYDVMKALSDGVIIEKGITKRKVRPGDIAILVSKGAESEAIQNELKSKGLQSVYFSEKGSVLTTVTSSGFIKKTSPSKEAVSLVYFMEAMCNSRDVSKISRLLGSDLFSLTQKEFKECTTAEMIDFEIQNISLCALKWEQFGFITAFNYYVRQHDLILKIMNREEGERSLTNYFQIAELIQSKKTQLPTPSAQLTWFKNELENDNGELSKDVTKKRLESEKDLIKIYTIHMSKGLQYPLVFLPYLFGAHKKEELGN